MSASRMFRLFVSSTFTDLKAERNALQRHVFPRLRYFCLRRDCRFQDIDLRWGISQEAGLDQRTMRICLQEVARCRDTTPRPNFVVLLGDRYGWRPLPFEIPAADFEELRTAANPAELALLTTWYPRLDENAIPPVYRLEPRDPGTPEANYETWRDSVEQPIGALLRRVNPRYDRSATEQEIEAGALPAGADHAFAFFRTISGFPPTGAGQFRDLLPSEVPDPVATARLQDVKARLVARLGTIPDYPAAWLPPDQWSLPPDQACSSVAEELLREVVDLEASEARLTPSEWAHLEARRDELLRGWPAPNPLCTGPPENRPLEASPITLDHLPALCADVFLRLAWVMLREIAATTLDPVEAERTAHRQFGAQRAHNFVGRKAPLGAIEAYLHSATNVPLAVVGDSGSGKTALLAHAVEQATIWRPGTRVVARFVGATPESGDGRSLLHGICQEVARWYRAAETNIPNDYRTLAREFPERLELAATDEEPLAVFIDALDMLAPTDRAHALGWLPRRLPPHVALVVSTTPGDGQAAVERRLGTGSMVQLGSLSLWEGARLLRRWLDEAGRRLTRRQRRLLMQGFGVSRLPLYLKLALETAREWPSSLEPEPLPTDATGLIQTLFRRLSTRSNHDELLVASMAYLAAARHGLTEDEMLDVLSRDEAVMGSFRERAPDSPPVTRLPVVVWSRLYHDLQSYLTSQRADGTTVLTFYHQQVKRVATAMYLDGEPGKARHAHLARYYEDDQRLSVEAPVRDPGGPASPEAPDRSPMLRVHNLRKLVEQPYQQTLSHRWSELAATLGNLDFLQAKVEAGAGHDAMADFDRAEQEFPEPESWDDPHEQSRVILREFGSAFNQEASAFLSYPESTAQQIYGNLFALTGFEGQAGEVLRTFSGPRRGSLAWLRRLSRSPRTATPRVLVRTIAAHPAEVTALALSPDAEWIASGARDGDIRVFRRPDGAEAAGFRVGGAVLGLAWIGGSGAPLRLVSADQADERTRLTVWDWEAERAEAPAMEIAGRIRALSVTADGKVIYGGDDFAVHEWEPGTPRSHKLYTHQDRVLALAAARKSGLVMSGAADRTVRLWQNARGPEPPLRGHERPVRAVALDSEGMTRVSGDEGGVIRIWRTPMSSEPRSFLAHRHHVTCLGIVGQSEHVVSGSADTTIKTWDAGTGQPLTTLRAHTRPVTGLAADPDGKFFVSAGEDGTVRIWRSEAERRTRPESREHEDAVTVLCRLPDGRVASGGDDHTVRIWTPTGEHDITLRGHVGPISCLMAGEGWLLSGSADHTIRRWLLDGSGRVDVWGSPLAGLAQSAGGRELSGRGAGRGGRSDSGTGHARPVRQVIRAADTVFSAGDDGAIRAWDLATGRQPIAFEPVTGTLTALVLLDDWVAGGGSPREVQLWPRSGGPIQRRLEGHASSVTCLAAMEGNRLASGSLDGTVRVWSADGNGRVRWTHAARVNCLALDADSGVMASGSDDGRVLVGPVGVETPRELAGHSAPVRVLALRSDALVAGGDDGRVNLWRIDGSLIATLSVGSAVRALMFPSSGELWVGTQGASVARFGIESGGNGVER